MEQKGSKSTGAAPAAAAAGTTTTAAVVSAATQAATEGAGAATAAPAADAASTVPTNSGGGVRSEGKDAKKGAQADGEKANDAASDTGGMASKDCVANPPAAEAGSGGATSAGDAASTTQVVPAGSAGAGAGPNAGATGAAAEKDSDAIKLFVGQVPRHFSDQDLRAILVPFGNIFELVILKDKRSGMHKGCAFVTYCRKADALAAQSALHASKTLPGMVHPMQVKLADCEISQPNTNANAIANANTKLFVGMVSKLASEDQLRTMFQPFGQIVDLTILRHHDGSSKGCAFIKFQTREECMAAIATMSGALTMEGASLPLVVKMADSERDKAARWQAQMSAAHYASPFGMGPGGVGGMPYHPATVSYGQHFAAAHGHHNPHHMHGGPMHVPGPQGYGAVGGYLTHGGYPGQAAHGGYGVGGYGGGQQQQQQQQAQQAPPQQQQQQHHRMGMMHGGGAVASMHPSHGGFGHGAQTAGPDGANLFIYHLPAEFGDADLAQTFAPYGTVLSAKVFVDKYTAQSKCFGFVSYDRPQSAQLAIDTMNGFEIGQKRLKVQLKRPALGQQHQQQ